MRLLWLCNMTPGKVKEALTGNPDAGGLWVDHVLSDLREQGLTIHILCPGDGVQGALDDGCSYRTFREGLPYVYLPELEKLFREELESFRPDVIHIWGTEYGHTLAMLRTCEKLALLDCTAVSIQGLCSVYAGHFNEGVPYKIQKGSTFRDLVRRDNLLQQQEKFAKRGELEVEALKLARHIIGRTRWDAACTAAVNPKARYHFCNETLRQSFYEGQWAYDSCKKHRIFASGFRYPLKGMHYLLQAMGEVVKHYPDATLAIPGQSYLKESKLRQTLYRKYLTDLTRQYGLEERIEFMGKLSADGMKAAYLSANVFVLPSAIENSPNSLGEAMLLGVPCVASDVGGVTDLMTHNAQGYVYPSTAPYMLAHYIMAVFAMEDRAEELGRAARAHARKTHDPETNLTTLLEIYRNLA